MFLNSSWHLSAPGRPGSEKWAWLGPEKFSEKHKQLKISGKNIKKCMEEDTFLVTERHTKSQNGHTFFWSLLGHFLSNRAKNGYGNSRDW